MAVPTINTNRLVLRPYEDSDVEALHAVFSDEETMRWWVAPPQLSVADTRNYIAGLHRKYPDFACWIVTHKDNLALGWVTLREKNPGVAKIGYILNRACHGGGYGREASAAIISHGFDAMGYRRIVGETDPENVASIKLLRAHGFTLEGHLRADWDTHIGVRDSLIFGLLADEWGKSLS